MKLEAVQPLSAEFKCGVQVMQLRKRKNRKTVRREALSRTAMAAGNERHIKAVIEDGDLLEWCGIGWLRTRPATKADLKKYPRVVGG